MLDFLIFILIILSCTILTGIVMGMNMFNCIFWPVLMIKDFYDTLTNKR